ncbi:MAG: cupin domain-containing protein [Gemmatimonadales bacterium]|nr:cupin domain-containing protein [Gemmatimonadales bacterium]
MNVDDVVRRLALRPHPEGGYYGETFRSPLRLTLPDGRVRCASTAIHYLLPAGAWSTWHRVRSDEIWHHYDGGALRLYRLGLGDVRLSAETPQATVTAGTWQAAEPEADAVLCGCTVAPGFEFADFELGSADALAGEYPDRESLIRRLGR